jgi:hypothetical protein
MFVISYHSGNCPGLRDYALPAGGQLISLFYSLRLPWSNQPRIITLYCIERASMFGMGRVFYTPRPSRSQQPSLPLLFPPL